MINYFIFDWPKNGFCLLQIFYLHICACTCLFILYHLLTHAYGYQERVPDAQTGVTGGNKASWWGCLNCTRVLSKSSECFWPLSNFPSHQIFLLWGEIRKNHRFNFQILKEINKPKIKWRLSFPAYTNSHWY